MVRGKDTGGKKRLCENWSASAQHLPHGGLRVPQASICRQGCKNAPGPCCPTV